MPGDRAVLPHLRRPPACAPRSSPRAGRPRACPGSTGTASVIAPTSVTRRHLVVVRHPAPELVVERVGGALADADHRRARPPPARGRTGAGCGKSRLDEDDVHAGMLPADARLPGRDRRMTLSRCVRAMNVDQLRRGRPPDPARRSAPISSAGPDPLGVGGPGGVRRCRPAPRSRAALLRQAGWPRSRSLSVDGGQPAVLGHRPGAARRPDRAAVRAPRRAADRQPRRTGTATRSSRPSGTGGCSAAASADDKAGIAVHLAALRAHGDELPVGVTVLVEGEEEIGSPTLAPFLATYPDKLRADVVVFADAVNWTAGHPVADHLAARRRQRHRRGQDAAPRRAQRPVRRPGPGRADRAVPAAGHAARRARRRGGRRAWSAAPRTRST